MCLPSRLQRLKVLQEHRTVAVLDRIQNHQAKIIQETNSINTTKDSGNAEDNTKIPASNADHAKSDAWNPAIIIIIGICILLIVFCVVIFARKKSGSEEE